VFARYGADPIRLFVLAAVPSVLSFGSTAMTSPFAGPSALAGLSALLSLLATVLGFVSGSVTLALLDGGPRMSFARALRRGLERVGWFFLTAIVIGLGFLVVILIALIPLIVAVFVGNAAIAVIVVFAIFLVVVYLTLRLALAIVGNVVDNLNTIDAIKVSWRVTRPMGVWLRILAAALVIGLVVVPASLAGVVLLFPGMFGQPLLFIAAGLVLAIITPITSILTYAAYRRLVPPIAPWWAATAVPPTPPVAGPPPVAVSPGPAAPITVSHESVALEPTPAPPTVPAAAPASPTAPAAAPLVSWSQPSGAPAAAAASATKPVFAPPRFGLAGQVILVLMLALGVGGIVSVGWFLGELAGGRVNFPTLPGMPGSSAFPGFPGLDGEVTPGTVAFGTSSDLDTCTVQGQTTVMPESGEILWIAAFTRRTSSTDEIRFRVTHDGQEIVNEIQAPGVFDCIGVEDPETGLTPGVYTFEVLLNGGVDARGTLIVI
jgi:hypothetical protein